MSADATSVAPRRPGIVWSWPHALVGVAFAAPAAVVSLHDPRLGVPLALGVLPAAMVGIPPARRARLRILIIGVMTGASIFLGGLLAHLPWIATAVLLVAAVTGAAVLASAVPFGRIILTLCAPLVGAGLSYVDFRSSAETFLLLSLGAAYACLVAMFWPARSALERPQVPLPARRAMIDYGIRMGVASALVYAVAAGLGLDHPGWAPAACLLVARPQVDLMHIRGVGRVLSVIAGALAAALILRINPPNVIFAMLALIIVGAAAATVGSRWYVTSAFTTLLVFVMLLNGHPDQTISKFNERVGETVLGVAAAFLFGWAIPTIRTRPRVHRT
jgi:hypothetical protein